MVDVGVITGNDCALCGEIPWRKANLSPQKLPEFAANRNAISVKVSMVIPACTGALPQTWAAVHDNRADPNNDEVREVHVNGNLSNMIRKKSCAAFLIGARIQSLLPALAEAPPEMKQEA